MSVLLKQLDAFDAQIEILKGMSAAMRASLVKPAPTATIELPAVCRGYKSEDCARRGDEGAIEMGGMGGGPVTIMCRGCGEQIQTR